ncbi:MAG: fibronectin type III-like domain-contianing protein [Phycisphaerae bacterium]
MHPIKQLVAFTRISLKPGESGQVRFVIRHEDRVRLKRLFLGGP